MTNNYKDLYKKSVDLGEQQKLRQLKLLKEQKQRRHLQQDEHRLVLDSEEEEAGVQPGSSAAKRNQRVQNHAQNKKGQHFKLQQSEWLRHRPENLADWILVPCPVGKRYLIIASNGRTKVYNKAGRIIMQLKTLLPGDGQMQKSKTALDCVYVTELDTFYVLDALTFGQQLLLNCEASFRFFWLRSRFDERGELGKRSKRNEKAFKLLDYYDFEDASGINQALQKYPQWEGNQPKLDGLLFYHKEASYTFGTTPLVCWLFAYMIPEILNLSVHSAYAAPDDYQPSAVLAYMDEFDKKLLLQRQQYKKPSKSTEPTKEVTTEMEEDELEEFAELRSMLDYQRRLELGELDMECTPASPAIGSSC